MKYTGIGILGVIAVAIAVAGPLYGCNMANQQYYEFANKCITNGGSWIPQSGGNGYSGICIHDTVTTK